MRCINCGVDMYLDADNGGYICKNCGVTQSVSGYWNIPQKYKPTNDQIKKIKYINRVLSESFEIISSLQCERLIFKYFPMVKRIAKLSLEAQRVAVREYHDEKSWRVGADEEDDGYSYEWN